MTLAIFLFLIFKIRTKLIVTVDGMIKVFNLANRHLTLNCVKVKGQGHSDIGQFFPQSAITTRLIVPIFNVFKFFSMSN